MIADGVTRIDNAPLREAFLRSRVSACVLAQRLGWNRRPSAVWRERGVDCMPDVVRIRVALGLKGTVKLGVRSYRKTLPYEQALAICRALDIDPVDVGL